MVNHRLKLYEKQVKERDDKIKSINAEIKLLDEETPTEQAIIDIIALRKARLEKELEENKERKAISKKLQDDEIEAETRTFTVEQKQIVDLISPKYKYYIDALQKMSDEKKTEFFDSYSRAETNVQKDCVIKIFFNI
jgi:chromosome segregation ATPase